MAQTPFIRYCVLETTFIDYLFSFFPILLNIIYLFIFSCAGSSLLCGLSLAAASGGYSLVVVCWLPVVLASLAVAHGL